MPARLRAAQLDPEAQALLRYLNLLAPRADKGTFDLRQMRRRWSVLARLAGRRVPVAAVENRSIEGPAGPLRLRIFRPQRPQAATSGGPPPVFLWFHGGGFVVGGIATADSICRNIAARSGAVVVTAQYRLAPEHHLHAGREDSLAVLDWIVAHAAELGVDAGRIAVGGDSAGGNLAAVLAQRAARRGHPPLRLQVLAYPATNLRDRFGSYTENGEGYLLTAANIDWFESLFGRNVDASEPLVSPALAPDVADVAPALIVSTGFDPIRDDGLAYAGLLRAAHVPVQLLHYGGQFHGFINFDAVLRSARDALDRIADALADAFAEDHARTPDRTCEIGTEARLPIPVGQAVRDMWVGSLMWAEWAEQKRNGLVAAALPEAFRPAGWIAHPLANPATLLRAQWAAALTRLEVRETYRRPDVPWQIGVPR